MSRGQEDRIILEYADEGEELIGCEPKCVIVGLPTQFKQLNSNLTPPSACPNLRVSIPIAIRGDN